MDKRGYRLTGGQGRPVLLWVTAAILSLPLMALLLQAFLPSEGIWQHLYQTVLGTYLSQSLVLMVGVGLLTLILGVSTAWFVAVCEFPGRRYFEWLLILPMAIPPYIIAYSYTWFLDVGGPVQVGLREMTQWQYGEYWFPQVRSMGGAIVVMSLVMYPYVYLLCRSAFISHSRALMSVSQSLGAGIGRSFYRVSLPLARPAMMGGLLLVLMETLADYGTVKYFGINTMTTGVLKTWFGLDSLSGAAQLASLMLVFVVVLLTLELLLRGNKRFHSVDGTHVPVQRMPLSGMKRVGVMVWCGLVVFLGFILPLLLLLSMLISTRFSSWQAEFITLLLNSVGLALVAALLTVVLTVLFSYIKRRHNKTTVSVLVRYLGLGYAIPGAVIAVGITIALGWVDTGINAMLSALFGDGVGILLSGSLFALVFAYLIRFMALSQNAVEAGLTGISRQMDEVGYLSGRNTLQIIKSLHIPLLRNSLLTATLLVFVEVLKELPATLVLRPFNFNTLAVKTYELASDEQLAASALPAIFIVLAGVIPVILISKSINISRHGKTT